ncbi:MAG: hypothetical protein Q4C85_02550 [Actinomyces sp.]|uniref:hypothetical protein n=1 Tax=Actinomyces sp. TaxID=29317 RepID=UPI0026DAA4E2|nr:hypothetical protein [Actinomyces sp.]MDO4242636.1 hypothetical protein [Actinomyces sp.]
MSEPSDVGGARPADGDDATHSSRRAKRQAERAAEREAYLTGQQPVLTRRELKRQREEAAALRAAVAAGELTMEQARALQNPLLDQSDIQIPATGSQGVPVQEEVRRTPEPVSPAAPVAPAAPAAPTPSWQRQPSSAPLAETPSPAATPTPSPVVPASPAPVTPSPLLPAVPAWSAASAASTHSPSPVATPSPVLPPVSAPPVSPPPVAAPAVPTAGAVPAPRGPEAPQVADAGLTADRIDELSEMPTGVYTPVDLPIRSPQVDSTPTGTSSLPERRSVLGRTSPAEPVDQGPTAGPAVPASPPASPATSWSPTTSAAPAGPASSPTTAPAVPSVGARPAGSAEPTVTASSTEVEDGDAAGPVRRPIVRVPSAAQGVRTIDIDSGELSAVQPVEDAAEDSSLHWRTLHSAGSAASASAAGAALSAGSAAAASPSAGSAAQAPAAAEPSSPSTTRGQAATGEGEEGYGGIDNPQWPSLHGGGPTGSGGKTIATSPYTSEPEPVAPERPGTAEPAERTSPAATKDVARAPEGKRTSTLTRVLLIALLVVVILLVILAVVWFVLLRDTASTAMAAQAIATWTSLLT